MHGMKGCDRSAVFEGGAHPWCRVGSFTSIAICHQLTWAPNPDSKCCLAPPPISTSARIFASASNFCPPARVQRACATTDHERRPSRHSSARLVARLWRIHGLYFIRRVIPQVLCTYPYFGAKCPAILTIQGSVSGTIAGVSF